MGQIHLQVFLEMSACVRTYWNPPGYVGMSSYSVGYVASVWTVSNIGASHWIQLSRSHAALDSAVADTLRQNRRRHAETAACYLVLEAVASLAADWPLVALRLRGSDSSALSHAHFSKSVLRQAYCNMARSIHPDRLLVPELATDAMAVLKGIGGKLPSEGPPLEKPPKRPLEL